MLSGLPAAAADDAVSAAAPGLPDSVNVVRGSELLMRGSNAGGPARLRLVYGRPGDHFLMGDWNGNGEQTPGIKRGNTYMLRQSLSGGPADLVFGYGRHDDVPLVGDWDGDGIDTIGVWREGRFLLRNRNRSGIADVEVGYGRVGDTPVVGDWNGDGVETVGVHRGATFFLTDADFGAASADLGASAAAQITFTYGRAGDTPLVGDWDGDGIDTVGVHRDGLFLLNNRNRAGSAAVSFAYGRADDRPLPSRSTIPAGAPPLGDPGLSVSSLVSGLSLPWGIDFTPDGTMLFTERNGVLSVRLADGTVRAVTADLGDLLVASETGLLDVRVDPDFASNRRFYTCQGHADPREIQVIAWTMDSAYTTATRASDPLVGGLPTVSGRHGGCRLRIGADGHLWIATGDAAVGTVPQSLTSLGGKVLRVDRFTGAGVAGNPFVGSTNADTRRIYSFGHRNLQGLDLRPGTTQMWTVEHGPSRDDEINLVVAGGNYGWNPVPGYNESVPMTFSGAVAARWSSGAPTLATSGGTFLEGSAWQAWEGRFAVASLKASELRLFEFDAAANLVSQFVVPQLDGTFGRLRTPEIGPDGALYVATANGSGDRILRIAPS